MHSCVYVIIGKSGDIEELVAKALQPFDEDLQVPPYKLHLSASTLTAMAQHYKCSETDHAALIEKMPDWLGYPGGQDHLGIFALQSHNPNGRWDWYEIGGRYNGRIRGSQSPKPFQNFPDLEANTLTTSRLLRSRGFADRLPFAVVTPHSQWVERSSFVTTSSGWYVQEEPIAKWTERVRTILTTFADHRVVCVDAHH
jgi:hypothetical protein